MNLLQVSAYLAVSVVAVHAVQFPTTGYYGFLSGYGDRYGDNSQNFGYEYGGYSPSVDPWSGAYGTSVGGYARRTYVAGPGNVPCGGGRNIYENIVVRPAAARGRPGVQVTYPRYLQVYDPRILAVASPRPGGTLPPRPVHYALPKSFKIPVKSEVSVRTPRVVPAVNPIRQYNRALTAFPFLTGLPSIPETRPLSYTIPTPSPCNSGDISGYAIESGSPAVIDRTIGDAVIDRTAVSPCGGISRSPVIDRTVVAPSYGSISVSPVYDRSIGSYSIDSYVGGPAIDRTAVSPCGGTSGTPAVDRTIVSPYYGGISYSQVNDRVPGAYAFERSVAGPVYGSSISGPSYSRGKAGDGVDRYLGGVNYGDYLPVGGEFTRKYQYQGATGNWKKCI